MGTASVAESERLGRALELAGIPNHILNARNDEQEADVADAAALDTSSTWTYLINDQPMGDLTQRLLRGLRNRMQGSN